MHKKTAFSNLVGTGGFVQIIENKNKNKKYAGGGGDGMGCQRNDTKGGILIILIIIINE